ncbi:MAG: DUF2169 domain-containing protein, partial [Proteobacteria bacterium]|nr:DUF2169 domain-containing protein [Pseudomonadota bacterium]
DITSDHKLEISGEQSEVCTEASFFGVEGLSSIRYETALQSPKELTDLTVIGHAYAPEGKPATEVITRIALNEWSKEIKIVGDRYWDRALFIRYKTAPEAFVKKEINYENAAYVHQQNPAGRGFYEKKGELIGSKLANVELLKHPAKVNFKRNRVAGFGPIPVNWAPRTKLAGTHDEQWQENRFPLRPLDFNPRHYQCAPEDQQFKTLQGGEEVVLRNLSPEGFLKFSIPEAHFEFETKMNGEINKQKSSLQSVIIEPGFPRVSLVWNMMLDCEGTEQQLESTRITLKNLNFY